MKKIKIPQYKYEGKLGSVTLKNLIIYLDDEDVEKYKSGTDLEELDYGLSADTIRDAENHLAVEFFKLRYREILLDKYQLSTEELVAIQRRLNLNNVEFSRILGVDKGSYSNILKRGKLSHTVGVLAIERLGNDLLMPGSAKRLIDPKAPLQVADAKTTKEIKEVIYGKIKPLSLRRKKRKTTTAHAN